jgi:histidine triad (HIT) family protein
VTTDCIFCKILAGEIPSTRIYEDAHVVAFMDIGPIVKGHALVIPREHVENITQASPAMLAQVIEVARKVAQAQLNGLKADGVNIFQANGAVAGQVVPHLHFHVVPRFKNDRHHWNWVAKKYDSFDEMKQLAEAIRKAL